jgi:hypothetical protein
VTINERLDAPPAPELRVQRGVPPVDLVKAPGDKQPPMHRAIPWLRIAAWLGVLIPLALLIKQAIVSPPGFDGAMNLQVAQNLGHGLGFSRQYVVTGGSGVVNHAAGTTLFPSEIQTSGAYVFLAAGLIKIFGASTFVFELPNLIFLVLLMVATSIALRRWPVARIIGPSLVVFAVPGASGIAMGGLGEYVIAALVIAAFVLLGGAASGGRRPVLAACGASTLIGVSLTVKSVAALALPALIIGLIGVAVARPAINRWKLYGSTLVLVIPVGIVEVQRLVSLGSFSSFATYWHDQFFKVGSQAGVSGSDAGSTATDPSHGLHKIADHVHLLALATGIKAPVLLLALAVPFAVLIGLFLCRRTSWREWLARPGALLAVMLATYAGGYLVWWLALTPTAKAWLRRIIIALVVVALLYLVLAGMARDRYQARRTLPGRPSARRTAWGGVIWGVMGVLALVSLQPALTTLKHEVRVSYDANSKVRGEVISMADAAKQLRAQGAVLYGGGWWSAPVVALYGDLPLRNLVTFDGFSGTPKYCDPASGVTSGKAYLIWDFYAEHLADRSHPTPYSLTYQYTPISAGASAYGAIYRISLRPDLRPDLLCSAGP